MFGSTRFFSFEPPAVSTAQAGTSVVLAGKRDSRRHLPTSFRENVVVEETSYQMREVLSFSIGRGLNVQYI